LACAGRRRNPSRKLLPEQHLQWAIAGVISAALLGLPRGRRRSPSIEMAAEFHTGQFRMGCIHAARNARISPNKGNDKNVTPSTPPTIEAENRWSANPWVVFLLPLAVYLVVGSFEPSPPTLEEEAGHPWIDLGIEYEHYPWIYGIKIVLTIAAIVAVARSYPRRSAIHPLAMAVGVAGVVVWIGLAYLQRWMVDALGLQDAASWLGGQRAAFNPLAELGHSPQGYLFLIIRFLGLAAVVPLIEEMFLRGFLMRFFAKPDWWNVPIGTPERWGIAAAIVLPVLMHPQEALAAVVWFGGVAWLAVRTKNVWDCVVAHAVTNLLLGAYVLSTGNWWLM
jgi:CAAX prenyl protease-like protein